MKSDGEQLDALGHSPGRRRRRLVMFGAMIALLVLGGLTLAFSMYVGKQAEGFELTMQFGARTTHVLGTNVTLSEPKTERKCVLSLLDFRALREHARPLADVAPLEKAPRGTPTFMLSVAAEEGAHVNQGALAREQLEPIDAFVIQRASACIETYVPTAPTFVQ